MADGQVEVSVRADGVEDAAGEMAPDAAGADIGGPGGDGRGGGRLGGKLIGRLLGLLAFLGPILDVIGVMSQILEALIAPFAVVLLRFLQPFMMTALKALPYVIDIADFMADAIGLLNRMREAFWSAIWNGVQRLGGWILSLPERIWGFMQRLPDMIGMAVGNVLPDVPTLGGGDGFLSELRDAVGGGAGDFFGGPGEGVTTGGPVVNITGGLEAFIRRITQDSDFDFP
jgi:hypothetical protein